MVRKPTAEQVFLHGDHRSYNFDTGEFVARSGEWVVVIPKAADGSPAYSRGQVMRLQDWTGPSF